MRNRHLGICSYNLEIIIEPAPVSTGSGLDTFKPMNSGTSRPLKVYKTYAQQIDLLCERGLIINDPGFATKWLQEAGYYRLSLYMFHFRVTDEDGNKLNKFQDNTTFDEIVSLYVFDRGLRTRVFSGIEKIEVSLRARMGYLLGEYDPDVHMMPWYFRSTRKHTQLVKTFKLRIDRAIAGNDEVALHHEAQYGGRLPFWVLTDLLDFSDLSKMYEQLHSKDQRKLAREFELNDPPRKRKQRQSNLSGWLHQLSLVRNFTAHHSRLWDRKFGAKDISDAQGVRGFFQDFANPGQSKDMYGVLTIMAFLLESIEGNTEWARGMGQYLDRSFSEMPSKSPADMGFPQGWKTLQPWIHEK